MKLFGVTGWKNSGKTWLVAGLVQKFTARGVSVSTIKHAHHALDLDAPGRDTHRHREAGAQEVILATGQRWALMHELRDAPEPSPQDLLERLHPVDLVLVEGFKAARHPKIETYRGGQAPRAKEDESILAVASAVPLEGLTKPILDLNDIPSIADFIAAEVGL